MTAEVQGITKLEPGDWYAGFIKGFDSPPPQLLFNVNVAVGEAAGDSVVALLFETDEFPYVMPVKDKPNFREVPIRVGTHTHSANRRQLMRILAPIVASPPTEITELAVSARLQDFQEIPRQALPEIAGSSAQRSVSLHIRGSVFIEHVGPHAVAIPLRSLTSNLVIGDRRLSLHETFQVDQLRAPSVAGGGRGPEPIPPSFGVYAKSGSIVATGPGEFHFGAGLTWAYSPEDTTGLRKIFDLLLNQETVQLELSFKFAAAETPVTLRPVLKLSAPGKEPPEFNGEGWREWDLGKWTLDGA